MPTINIYHQRHGNHKHGSLTDEGKSQIIAEALEHLCEITFNYLFSSDMPRTNETTVCAMKAIDHNYLPIQEDPFFGFSYATNTDYGLKYPWQLAEDQALSILKRGGIPTVNHIFEIWPPANIIRAVLECHMQNLAQRFATCNSLEKINVFVGGHATNCLAAPDPIMSTGYMQFGNIVVYKWIVDDECNATLDSFEYLSREENGQLRLAIPR